jgi:hypothetical protein
MAIAEKYAAPGRDASRVRLKEFDDDSIGGRGEPPSYRTDLMAGAPGARGAVTGAEPHGV